jgi:hypothetical protein
MGNLEIFTTSERHDLDEEAKAAFLPTWPQFIFHDPVDAEYLDRAESYFPHYDVLLLEDGEVAAGGGECRFAGTGHPADCPTAAMTGH